MAKRKTAEDYAKEIKKLKEKEKEAKQKEQKKKAQEKKKAEEKTNKEIIKLLRAYCKENEIKGEENILNWFKNIIA